jgi:hypothetical protein
MMAKVRRCGWDMLMARAGSRALARWKEVSAGSVFLQINRNKLDGQFCPL